MSPLGSVALSTRQSLEGRQSEHDSLPSFFAMPPAVTFRRKVDQTMPFRHPSIHEFQSEYGVDLSDDLPDSASIESKQKRKILSTGVLVDNLKEFEIPIRYWGSGVVEAYILKIMK